MNTYESSDNLYLSKKAIGSFTSIGVSILIIYSLINFLQQDFPAAVFEFVLALVMLFGYLVIKKTGKFDLGTSIASISIFLLAIHNFYSGGFYGSGIFWVFVMASVIIFIKGKQGIIWVVTLLFVLLGIFLMSLAKFLYIPYHPTITITFFITISVVISFIYFFQNSLSASIQELVNGRMDVEKTNLENQKKSKELESFAKQLQEKSEELKKIYGLTVERELKMVEMKEKMKATENSQK